MTVGMGIPIARHVNTNVSVTVTTRVRGGGVTKVGLLHPDSSLRSLQSTWPSQWNDLGIHCSIVVQANSFMLQRSPRNTHRDIKRENRESFKLWILLYVALLLNVVCSKQA